MAIVAAAGLVEFWYTPEAEKDEAKPTRFKLRPLTQFDMLEVSGEIMVDEHGQMKATFKGQSMVLRRGIVGWEEFKTPDGKKVKFSEKNIELIPFVTLAELAGRVMEGATLSDEEKKD